MATSYSSPPLLTLPRELRDEILGYLTLPEFVFTSSSTPHTQNLHQGRHVEKTYIDTRIYVPSCPPLNMLATCRQLRDECLEHHARHLNSPSPAVLSDAKKKPMSSILAERLGTEVNEEAERACDDGTLRITIEVQRPQRGPTGYSIPTREELSPRFLALLPLMHRARKVNFILWPGYDWWNGDVVQSRRGIDKPDAPRLPTTQSNAASVAVGRILAHLPAVEQLNIGVLMRVSEGSRWDLPDFKWEKLQPWLDGPVTVEGGQTLKKVVRRLAGVWRSSHTEVFYTQIETSQGVGRPWRVERKGDMRTVGLIPPRLSGNNCSLL